MSTARWWTRDGALRDVLRLEDRRNDVVTAVMTFVLGWVLIEAGLVDLVRVDGAFGIVTPEPWWRLALLAAGCALILVKRAHPMLALAGGVAVMLVDLSWGGSLAITIVLWDLLYAAATWGTPRARSWLWGVTVAVTVLAAVAAGEAARDVRVFVYTCLQLGAVLLLPLWWATNVRRKSELAELERERANDLERIAELDRHDAVRSERAAMARDLHDVIASHLSAIAIHSGAALQLPADAGRDRGALEQVRASAVTSLEEMRSMILLLRSERRDGDEPVSAPGRLAELGDLLGSARTGGAVVTFTGAVDDVGELPAAVDQAVYRIAQEALTNALKHAPGAPVSVRLARVGDNVVLTVHDAGAPAGPTSEGPRSGTPPLGLPALSAGTGLLTMRERAEGLGGVLDAGPAPDGGWIVRAEIPASAPVPAPATGSGGAS